jgi:hypothetical protein
MQGNFYPQLQKVSLWMYPCAEFVPDNSFYVYCLNSVSYGTFCVDVKTERKTSSLEVPRGLSGVTVCFQLRGHI